VYVPHADAATFADPDADVYLPSHAAADADPDLHLPHTDAAAIDPAAASTQPEPVAVADHRDDLAARAAGFEQR
jgi:hypothetical protein